MHIEQLLSFMENVPGWFAREEGRLLSYAVLEAAMKSKSGDIVEIGAYCGRATTVIGSAAKASQRAKVSSIDPDESLIVGVPDVWTGLGKVAIFNQKIAALGLDKVVTLIRKRPAEVTWTTPLCFLYIDGLHDEANVAGDFNRFIGHVEKGGCVAFHDYGNPDCPAVKNFVDSLIRAGNLVKVASEFHLIILSKA